VTDQEDGKTAAGFVYILTNPAMPGMVKIGFSESQTSIRAVELSRPTGVPMEFELVYDELVSNCRAVERTLHRRFAAHRVNQKREFFRVPVRQVISALQEEAKAHLIEPSAEDRVDILPQLERRFRRYLRADLVGAYIVQVGDLVYLESVFQPHVYSKDQKIHRLDLGIIWEGLGEDDGPSFPASNGAHGNAQRFMETNTYSIHYLTDLFNEEANKHIDQLHRYQEQIPFGS
jgi:hypothetical protein